MKNSKRIKKLREENACLVAEIDMRDEEIQRITAAYEDLERYILSRGNNDTDRESHHKDVIENISRERLASVGMAIPEKSTATHSAPSKKDWVFWGSCITIGLMIGSLVYLLSKTGSV